MKLKTETYKGYKIYFKKYSDGSSVMASAGDINKYDGKTLFYAEAKTKNDVIKMIKDIIDTYNDVGKYIELIFKKSQGQLLGKISKGVLEEYNPRTLIGKVSSKRMINGRLQNVFYKGRMKRIAHRTYEVI